MSSKFPNTMEGDALIGAGEIARFMCLPRWRVYELANAKRLPHYRVGRSICARRSAILDYIAAQEARSVVEQS
jgi:excisionase family DNA binding protein